jgi:DNA polymerase/3'-5' exonuclease PolX
MSTGEKISKRRAERIAHAFGTLIEDVTAWEICGSLRRQRPTVGDIEIVALPEDRQTLLIRLDRLVLDGTCSKAAYGNNMSPRWGDTYRGLTFEGVKVEVFCATKENHGYIRWLRTGPGDANTHVMTRMKQENWAVRFREGSAWHIDDDGQHKLNASTEDLIFPYLGLDYVEPENRSIPAYGQVCQRRIDPYFLRAHWLEEADEPRQQSMF